ncbi:hypothetical protein PFAG_00490 [Plasmodium falciparum Santa Lucia]|uniref:Uncharacterized protein n=2 Tax=Plasmodium falciparum TaxID=5833 RepID=A0A024WE51_PLAFA|nr:hypothetical protein PFTANZ_00627 [Plasmodium falciparum Tanzania (2000708)]EUT92352.1 hypothetical protein PFAG_00490 [Plasmodium falciparum Santa Lucia]
MTFKQIYIYELITNTIYLFVHFIFLIFQSVGLKNNQQLEMKFLHITRIIQFFIISIKFNIIEVYRDTINL